jgi:hypothetical protein
MSYRRRRERYAALARRQGLVYRAADTATAVRSRLRSRGYSPSRRKHGEIHTFAFIPDLGWHRKLLPDLRELGPVTLFDYVSLGFHWDEFYAADRRGLRRRREMNELVLPALRAAHWRQPVDWVFVYASGLEISATTIERIVSEIGVPVVNMCFDDKNSWSDKWMGDHHAGQIDLAAMFDLSWTSARVACEWYLAESGRPLYMPEGFDLASFPERKLRKEYPVSFVGTAYGFRKSVVRELKHHGVNVLTFGTGWAAEKKVGELADVFQRTLINLGMGGIGYSESITNVKGRDFEAPGAGGGVYLTSFNADLAQHFQIGEEILCYGNRDELLELIRYYLARPEEAEQIALRGRARCLQQHRWLHRYLTICGVLGIIDEPLDTPSFESVVARQEA